MVDLHSHILPGLDDGAATLDDSLAMLRLAAASGTTDIVATPHCNAEYPFQPETVAHLIRELATYSGVPTIHSGCDFHLSYNNLRDALDHPSKYTVNHGPYLMVELPDLTALPPTRSALRQLLGSRIYPIITHPERNSSLQREPSQLKAWVQDGCRLQVTAGSLLGHFGKRAHHTAHLLMRAKLVHFIASDAHDLSRRPPDLSAAFEAVSKQYGATRARALFVENPAAVVEGRPLPAAASEPFRLFSLFTRLYKRGQ